MNYSMLPFYVLIALTFEVFDVDVRRAQSVKQEFPFWVRVPLIRSFRLNRREIAGKIMYCTWVQCTEYKVQSTVQRFASFSQVASVER